MDLFDLKNSKAQAIHILRKKIIECINKSPSTTYELASLLWGAAAECFPDHYNWDGAWFKIDLQTKELYADVSTYPNQFGAAQKTSYTLTASEFHSKAVRYNMSKELQCMETDEDWQALFDDKLNDAIVKAVQELNEQHKKKEKAARISHGVLIPDSFKGKKPTMEYDEIELELRQRYGSSRVWLTKESGKYVLISFYGGSYQRELSPVESAWVEKQINDCMKNSDKTIWQSTAGGDRMSVRIQAQNKTQIELKDTTPLYKYYELMDLLEKLAMYGSFSETEMKEIQK